MATCSFFFYCMDPSSTSLHRVTGAVGWDGGGGEGGGERGGGMRGGGGGGGRGITHGHTFPCVLSPITHPHSGP